MRVARQHNRGIGLLGRGGEGTQQKRNGGKQSQAAHGVPRSEMRDKQV